MVPSWVPLSHDRNSILLLLYSFSFDEKFLFYFFVFLPFLGLLPQHMEVTRLGVKSELQLPPYTTATAMPDPSLRPTPQLTATPDP